MLIIKVVLYFKKKKKLLYIVDHKKEQKTLTFFSNTELANLKIKPHTKRIQPILLLSIYIAEREVVARITAPLQDQLGIVTRSSRGGRGSSSSSRFRI